VKNSVFKRIWKKKKTILLTAVLAAVVGIQLFIFQELVEVKESVNTELAEISKETAKQAENYKQSLYKDHLQNSAQIELESQVSQLEKELSEIEAKEENQEYVKLQEIFSLYSDVVSKVNRNQEAEQEVATYSARLDAAGRLLLDKKYTELEGELQSIASSLDADYESYLASFPTPEPAPSNVEGYSYVNIGTERGQFGVHLIKVPLSSVRVVTSAASSTDCDNNCPTKPLGQHIQDHGGFAGINGPYFCPPDYDSCAGKVNSTDYAFYNSDNGQWLNEDALSWNKTGLGTFDGHSADFYRESSDYDGDSVDAGVSNYPALLSEGNVVVATGDLTSYQTDVRGPRGAIGVDDSNLYLAIVSGATVPEAAYAMKALGAEDALNLDGGGSSALYINGSYVVGPGRQLPNAIVLTK